MPGLPELLLSALEGIGDGFLIFDADWRYAYLNPTAPFSPVRSMT